MKKIKKGFTLIEVVVSMALLVLVFGGLIGVLILGQEAKINLKNNLIAGNLAQEGIDLVRFIRDQNYDNDAKQDSEVFATISGDGDTPYSFTIMSKSDGEITVTPYSGGSVKILRILKFPIIAICTLRRTWSQSPLPFVE